VPFPWSIHSCSHYLMVNKDEYISTRSVKIHREKWKVWSKIKWHVFYGSQYIRHKVITGIGHPFLLSRCFQLFIVCLICCHGSITFPHPVCVLVSMATVATGDGASYQAPAWRHSRFIVPQSMRKTFDDV